MESVSARAWYGIGTFRVRLRPTCLEMALSLVLRRAPVRAVVQPALLARSFFGGKKDAGGRSQSKVLSDPEGDLFELQCKARLVLRHVASS